MFADVTEVLTGDSGRIRWDGHRRVRALPKHYGICGECRALAPCPREQADRQAAHLQASQNPIHSLETTLRGW